MKNVYIKEEKGYVIDLVEVYKFVENRTDYRKIIISSFPRDILSGWYKFVDNDFVIDEEKKKEILSQREESIREKTILELIEWGVIQ